MDPSVFRRYFREEEEEPQERDNEGGEVEASTAGGYNRSDVRNYKMPRRKTRRRRRRKTENLQTATVVAWLTFPPQSLPKV